MDWQFSELIYKSGFTYAIFTASHREGYTAFQLVKQKQGATKETVIQPSGNGHYTHRAALMKRFNGS